MDDNGMLLYVNNKDGMELLNSGRAEKFQGRYRTPEQDKYYQEKIRQRSEYATNGEKFIWALFKYGNKYMDDLPYADMARLVYLATYMNEKENSEDPSRLMKKSHANNILHLSPSVRNTFWENVTNLGIVKIVDKYVYINYSYFRIGDIKDIIKQDDINFTRIYIEFVRKLYCCTPARLHCHIGYILSLIPYIHRRRNVLCWNPEEQNDDKIKYMTIYEMCDLIGYSKKNIRRLIDELSSIIIDNSNVFGYFVRNRDYEEWVIKVNPELYYGGKYDIIRSQVLSDFLIR